VKKQEWMRTKPWNEKIIRQFQLVKETNIENKKR